jgi:hypothetical protein
MVDPVPEALNDSAPEAETTTPVVETTAPKTEEVKTEEVTSADATKTEPTTEVEEGSHKTANARIRELNAKAKAAEEKAQSLSEKIAELTGSVEPTNYVPQVTPGTEVTQEQYQNDISARADQIVQLRMKQKEVLDRVNEESRDSVKTYPQLDPSSEEFDHELSESISTATMAMISRTPTASVKKFVTSLMKPYLRSVGREVGKAQGEMAKQVTQAALRPTTVKAKEKTISEMSIKELEEKLGVVH